MTQTNTSYTTIYLNKAQSLSKIKVLIELRNKMIAIEIYGLLHNICTAQNIFDSIAKNVLFNESICLQSKPQIVMDFYGKYVRE